jgi:hypothetical protein
MRFMHCSNPPLFGITVGDIVVVNGEQYRVETPVQDDPLYEKLHYMSQSRKNGFLEKVKHHILDKTNVDT